LCVHGPRMCDPALAHIGNRRRKFTASCAAGALIAAILVPPGCGGDDEKASTTPAAARTETATTGSAPTETAEMPSETTETPSETSAQPTTAPEDMPGGAGDEEPAGVLALFTARGGRITPRVVRVPAFIQVKVELRSADGHTYGLRFGDTTITAGEQFDSVSTTIPGLRPGKAVTGTPTEAGNRVRIEATAEPGP
jgi:hypothetical protein